MAQHSLGAITVTNPGTSVQVTVNQLLPAGGIPCQSILIQVFANGDHVNTGRIYVKDKDGKRLATLAVPTINSVPAFSATVPDAPQALKANDYYLDADISGDGADVSILRP